MGTIDEIKDYQKYTSITFVDMLEALGRVADMMSLPSQSDLEAAGSLNAVGWDGGCNLSHGVVSIMICLPNQKLNHLVLE